MEMEEGTEEMYDVDVASLNAQFRQRLREPGQIDVARNLVSERHLQKKPPLAAESKSSISRLSSLAFAPVSVSVLASATKPEAMDTQPDSSSSLAMPPTPTPLAQKPLSGSQELAMLQGLPLDAFAARTAKANGLHDYMTLLRYRAQWQTVARSFGLEAPDDALVAKLTTQLRGVLNRKVLLDKDVLEKHFRDETVIELLSVYTMLARHAPKDPVRASLQELRLSRVSLGLPLAKSEAKTQDATGLEKDDHELLLTKSGSVVGSLWLGPLVFQVGDVVAKDFNLVRTFKIETKMRDSIQRQPDTMGQSPAHMMLTCLYESCTGRSVAGMTHPLLDTVRYHLVRLADTTKVESFSLYDDFFGVLAKLFRAWSAVVATAGGSADADAMKMEALAACLDLCTLDGAFPWRARYPASNQVHQDTLALYCLTLLTHTAVPATTTTSTTTACNALRMAFVELDPLHYRRSAHDDDDDTDDIKQAEAQAERARVTVRTYAVGAKILEHITRLVTETPWPQAAAEIKSPEDVRRVLLHMRLASLLLALHSSLALAKPPETPEAAVQLRWPFAGLTSFTVEEITADNQRRIDESRRKMAALGIYMGDGVRVT